MTVLDSAPGSIPASDLPVAGIRIAGRNVERPLADVVNPARTGDIVGRVALGEASDVDAAVRSAVEAAPAWAATAVEERADYLRRAADLLEPRLHEQARLLTAEIGKVLPESIGDAIGASRLLRIFASYAPEVAAAMSGEGIQVPVGDAVVRWVPKGPVAVIPPWNSPIYLAFMAVAPALMGGNPVIVKPPEIAPLALTDALVTLADALPPGVLNIVNGLGPTAGAALAGHPGVRKVLFTGSIPTGVSVMKAAAENITDVGMELGGNDAAIILDDALIDDDAIAELLAGAFSLSGQICYNVKRIYVHRSRFDEFVGRFVAAVDRIAVGDPADERTVIGPVTTAEGRARLAELLDDARARGARVELLGSIVDHATWDDGYYVRPSVVIGGDPEARVVVEEQFGPIIPVLPFDDDDEAVAYANSTEFGLAGSVWSADEKRAAAVARRIQAGTVFINVHRVGASPAEVPFGGFKRSGIGRNHGVESVLACMEAQSIVEFDGHDAFPGLDRWRDVVAG